MAFRTWADDGLEKDYYECPGSLVSCQLMVGESRRIGNQARSAESHTHGGRLTVILHRLQPVSICRGFVSHVAQLSSYTTPSLVSPISQDSPPLLPCPSSFSLRETLNFLVCTQAIPLLSPLLIWHYLSRSLGPFTQDVHRIVTITNNDAKPVVFKVMTTAPKVCPETPSCSTRGF